MHEFDNAAGARRCASHTPLARARAESLGPPRAWRLAPAVHAHSLIVRLEPMRPRVALCALLALAAVAVPPAVAAGRSLPEGAALLGGGKPWEKKPADNGKPLIGILAQVSGASSSAGCCWGPGSGWFRSAHPSRSSRCLLMRLGWHSCWHAAMVGAAAASRRPQAALSRHDKMGGEA